jgi:hypothetical protein
MECILASHDRHAECTRMKHVATTQLTTDTKMGSVEWITPSTLAIPVMRHSTRIKHVAHLVWLCKKVSLTKSNVLGVSKINHRLISHLKEAKIPSRASRSSLSLMDQHVLENQTTLANFIQKPVIKVIN